MRGGETKMRRWSTGVAAVLVAIMLLAPMQHAWAVSATPAASPETGVAPAYAPASACMYPLDLMGDSPLKIDCGWVTAPMYPGTGSAESVELPVIVIHSRSSNPGAPVMFLNGGPGQTLQQALLMFTALPLYDFLLDDHDVILFDQRGIGMATPSMACPFEGGALPIGKTELATPDLTSLESSSWDVALPQCADALRAQGIDFAAFTTRNNAADVDAIRQALGFEKVDLYGVSYGSRLALTVMRDYPEGIGAVVLSSTLPLESDPYLSQILGFNDALQAIFAGCEASPICNERFPHLEQTLIDLVARLNEEPLVMDGFDALLGSNMNVTLDGTRLLQMVYVMTFMGVTVRDVPLVITSVANGDTEPIGLYLSMMQLPESSETGITVGALMTYNCQDEAPFSSPADIQRALDDADVMPPLRDGSFAGLGSLADRSCAA